MKTIEEVDSEIAEAKDKLKEALAAYERLKKHHADRGKSHKCCLGEP